MSTDQKKRATTGESNQLTAEGETEQQPAAGESREEHVSAPEDTAQQLPAQKPKQANRGRPKLRRRLFPIWLRLLVVLALSAAALGAGLMIGYGVIGDGNPLDALKWETWQHIIDLVAKET